MRTPENLQELAIYKRHRYGLEDDVDLEDYVELEDRAAKQRDQQDPFRQ